MFDTNVIISGRLWGGACAEVLALADERVVVMLMSEAMLDELHDVLQRPKFATRLQQKVMTAEAVVALQLAHCELVEAGVLPPIILDDPDDDMLLMCAMGGDADLIVSGDGHLLRLGEYKGIRIVSVQTFFEYIQPVKGKAND